MVALREVRDDASAVAKFAAATTEWVDCSVDDSVEIAPINI